jgi:hypothetical protein
MSAFSPWPSGVPQPKPAKGSAQLDRRARRAVRVKGETEAMQEARRRDMANCHGCRFPRCEFMARKPTLDVCHEIHRGMGGNPKGDRTTRDTLILYCRPHHGQYDRHDIDHEPLTPLGTDGPCLFKRRNRDGVFETVEIERLVGVSETRGA